MTRRFRLALLPHELSIVRRSPDAAIPAWASGGSFFSITRADDELSIVCETSRVPKGEQQSNGWRVFRVDGPLDFSEVGVLSSLSTCLASASVSLFVLSTWDTDYIMVRAAETESASRAFEGEGHAVRILH